MTSPNPRTDRIEKLARDLQRVARFDFADSMVADWVRKNGFGLATLLRDLKTRIEAEDGGGL